MTICFFLEDLNLKTGVTIPAGAILVVPLQLVQMDESTWGSDAGQFNPRRLLSNAEKKSDSVHLTSFAGFSSALIFVIYNRYTSTTRGIAFHMPSLQ